MPRPRSLSVRARCDAPPPLLLIPLFPPHLRLLLPHRPVQLDESRVLDGKVDALQLIIEQRDQVRSAILAILLNIAMLHCPAGKGFVILGREKGTKKKFPLGGK